MVEEGGFEVLIDKGKEQPYIFARDIEIELMVLRSQQPKEVEKKKEVRIHVPNSE